MQSLWGPQGNQPLGWRPRVHFLSPDHVCGWVSTETGPEQGSSFPPLLCPFLRTLPSSPDPNLSVLVWFQVSVEGEWALQDKETYSCVLLLSLAMAITNSTPQRTSVFFCPAAEVMGCDLFPKWGESWGTREDTSVQSSSFHIREVRLKGGWVYPRPLLGFRHLASAPSSSWSIWDVREQNASRDSTGSWLSAVPGLRLPRFSFCLATYQIAI